MTCFLDSEEVQQPLISEHYKREWEARDPGGVTRAHYRRVWDLGGPYQLQHYHPLPDEYLTLSSCMHYPFRIWADWLLDPENEDDLRWWPQLAFLASMQTWTVRSHEFSEDLSLSEIAKELRSAENSLRSAAAAFLRIDRARSVPRPPVQTEQNKDSLLWELQHNIGTKWNKITRNEGALTWLPHIALTSLADACGEEAEKVGGLEPAQFKVGAERIAGLVSLVWRGGAIWLGLRGRKPSAERVESKDGETDPPFVRFIQGVCALTGSYEPTRLQVRSAIEKAVSAGLW